MFEAAFTQQEVDRLNRYISYLHTAIRNLATEIEEGDMSVNDVVGSLRGMVGEE